MRPSAPRKRKDPRRRPSEEGLAFCDLENGREGRDASLPARSVWPRGAWRACVGSCWVSSLAVGGTGVSQETLGSTALLPAALQASFSLRRAAVRNATVLAVPFCRRRLMPTAAAFSSAVSRRLRNLRNRPTPKRLGKKPPLAERVSDSCSPFLCRNSLPRTTRRIVAFEERPAGRSSSCQARWCLHDSLPLPLVTARGFHFVFLHPVHVNSHCNYIAAGK